MIRTHPGPGYTGLSIFEFGFDFAETFDHQVRKFRLRGVLYGAE